MVRNLPYNAGDMGLIPSWRTEIPYVTEQLSLCATTTKACMLWSEHATTREPV